MTVLEVTRKLEKLRRLPLGNEEVSLRRTKGNRAQQGEKGDNKEYQRTEGDLEKHEEEMLSKKVNLIKMYSI